MRLPLLSGAALLALVALGVALSLPHGTVPQDPPEVGRLAPEITGGPWINSAPVSLEALRGRVVVVEFWTYG